MKIEQDDFGNHLRHADSEGLSDGACYEIGYNNGIDGADNAPTYPLNKTPYMRILHAKMPMRGER